MLAPKCNNTYNYATSFSLKCYEDMAIGVLPPAILVALSISTNGGGLLKKLSYPRCCSGKFAGYFILTIVCAAIPAIIFLNPLWGKLIDTDANAKAGLLWTMNVLGFSISILIMVAVAPRAVEKCGLAQYATLASYTSFNQEVLTVQCR